MIFGERIRQAREFKGMKQTDLARAIGVRQAAISQMEYGEFVPSDETLAKIAQQTGFLPSFFEMEPEDILPFGTLNYRARRAATIREETTVYQYANLVFQQIRRLSQDVVLPPNRVPQLSGMPLAQAVQITRDELGLGPTEPIKKLLRILEQKGVIVLNVPRRITRIDAFSTWAQMDEERPIIALVSQKAMDRTRFSLSHELAHLVLHRTIKSPLRLVENEANSFAASFLMPEMAMREEIRSPVTLTLLAKLKLRWGVAMAALVMRAQELRIITQRQAKYLFAQMSVQGWRTREPENLDVKVELPQTVRGVIESRYHTREDYASSNRLTMATATELYAYA